MFNLGLLTSEWGNNGTLARFFSELNFNCIDIESSKQISSCDYLVIPGVGAFGNALRQIRSTLAFQEIIDRHKSGKPIMGICLGFQILGNSSEESPETCGLGLFPDKFIKMTKSDIGWTKINETYSDNDFLYKSFYFNHNYGSLVSSGDSDDQWMNEKGFVSYRKIDNTVGVQFHPEKSQIMGFQFMKWLLRERLN